MISFTTRVLALFALSAAFVVSAPLKERDVFVPPVTYPHAGTVWEMGSSHNVTWDTSNAPSQITNKFGSVVLAKDGLEDWENPLASGFNILDGSVVIRVPSDITAGTNYAIVVFGDSGNYSPPFTIVEKASKREFADCEHENCTGI